MVLSEYESMETIHKVVPEFCPKPIVWGSCQTQTDTQSYFILYDYIDMVESTAEVDVSLFVQCLAAVH